MRFHPVEAAILQASPNGFALKRLRPIVSMTLRGGSRRGMGGGYISRVTTSSMSNRSALLFPVRHGGAVRVRGPVVLTWLGRVAHTLGKGVQFGIEVADLCKQDVLGVADGDDDVSSRGTAHQTKLVSGREANPNLEGQSGKWRPPVQRLEIAGVRLGGVERPVSGDHKLPQHLTRLTQPAPFASEHRQRSGAAGPRRPRSRGQEPFERPCRWRRASAAVRTEPGRGVYSAFEALLGGSSPYLG